jgi:hypothetical protein
MQPRTHQILITFFCDAVVFTAKYANMDFPFEQYHENLLLSKLNSKGIIERVNEQIAHTSATSKTQASLFKRHGKEV